MNLSRRPKFCHNCGAALPPGEPRFCIECGQSVGAQGAPPAPPATDLPPVGRQAGPTVRLGNARVEQSVIGGTVQLPSSGAIPPGLWVLDAPPGAENVVAIYPPLRPVVGGWSGQTGRGWRKVDQEARGTQMVFRFATELEWFAAPGCGAGLRLRARVEASSRATEGKERRGFRYGLRRDGPMRLAELAWRDAEGRPRPDLPLPQVQIMAPPRVPRVSDFAEQVTTMPGREAAGWAAGGATPGPHYLRIGDAQEQTPVGRGITLVPAERADLARQGWWQRLFSPGATPIYVVRLERPFVCALAEWEQRLPRIRDEARTLGLDLDPALAAEWWLDRLGHDGVVFSAATTRYNAERVVIAFRRAQLALVR